MFLGLFGVRVGGMIGEFKMSSKRHGRVFRTFGRNLVEVRRKFAKKFANYANSYSNDSDSNDSDSDDRTEI